VLSGILILLSFQLIGEVLHRACSLSLPGPVLGMFLLTVFLLWKPRALSAPLRSTSRLLFEWLGLLFVPAGVGVIANFGLIRDQWIPILVGLVGSTLLSLVVTAYLMHRVSPRPGRDGRVGQS
jgi:holin-like protein